MHHFHSSRFANVGSMLSLITVSCGMVVGLIACSSGGGGTGASLANSGFARPEAPLNVTLTATPVKTFHLTWQDGNGETEYRLLEEPEPGAGFSMIASLPEDSTEYDHLVFLPARINARYLVQACNAAGCTDSAPVSVTNTLPAIGYVKASHVDDGNFFGFSVALSADGHTLAVGAPLEDSTVVDSGAVYVFVRNGSSWSLQADLRMPSPGASDWLGFSLALSEDGNTLAVGVPLADHGAPDSGVVHVFVRTGTSWTQQAILHAAVPEVDEEFGVAVTLSADGRTLAVGAPRNDTTVADSGAVYLFTFDGSTWTQQTVLKAGTPGAGDQFGTSASLSANGRILAVGAPFNDSAAADGGAVYLFTFDGANWTQQAILTASHPDPNDQFGLRVLLTPDGQTLAVGAPFEDSAAMGINGDQHDNSALDSGAVYLFTSDGSAWAHQAYLKASNTQPGDWFGTSLALSDDTLVVGAPLEDGTALDSGAIYLY